MTRDDGYTRYTIRVPTPLYERVKEAAGEASVNSLIVATLEEKYPAPEPDLLTERYEALLEEMTAASRLAFLAEATEDTPLLQQAADEVHRISGELLKIWDEREANLPEPIRSRLRARRERPDDPDS